jgi:hypothetical protein
LIFGFGFDPYFAGSTSVLGYSLLPIEPVSFGLAGYCSIGSIYVVLALFYCFFDQLNLIGV